MKRQQMIADEAERLLDTAAFTPWSGLHISEAISESAYEKIDALRPLMATGRFAMCGAELRHITYNYWLNRATEQAEKNINRHLAMNEEFAE